MDYFDHKLLWLDGVDYVLSQRFLLDGVGKRFGYFVVDIGIEEGAAHVLEGFGYVDFGNLALAFEYLEAAFESFA